MYAITANEASSSTESEKGLSMPFHSSNQRYEQAPYHDSPYLSSTSIPPTQCTHPTTCLPNSSRIPYRQMPLLCFVHPRYLLLYSRKAEAGTSLSLDRAYSYMKRQSDHRRPDFALARASANVTSPPLFFPRRSWGTHPDSWVATKTKGSLCGRVTA